MAGSFAKHNRGAFCKANRGAFGPCSTVEPGAVWVGETSDRLYYSSGVFTSTIKDSRDVSGYSSTAPQGVGVAGGDTPWCATAISKNYLQSSIFSSTLKTSLAQTGALALPAGISYDGADVITYAAGTAFPSVEKLLLTVGLFSTTISTSVDLSAESPAGARGVSWDGTNTPRVTTGSRLRLTSGKFSTTIKTSLNYFSSDSHVSDISQTTDLDTLICGRTGQRNILLSGQFSSTVKDSLSVASKETSPNGLESAIYK